MDNDVVYIRAPDWWPEPIPKGHCLKFLKSMYGTRQAARRWHNHILAWMEANGYLAVSSEKAFFMKHEGKHFIIHGLFVDDIMHIATKNKVKYEFMKKYSRDFNITGGGFMKTFLGMEIKQSKRSIKLHLDHYVCEMLNEYKAYIKESLRPMRVLTSPGVIHRPEDSPTLPDPSKQKFYRSFVAKRFSLRLHGFAFISLLQYRSWLVLCFGRRNPLGSTSSLDRVCSGPSWL